MSPVHELADAIMHLQAVLRRYGIAPPSVVLPTRRDGEIFRFAIQRDRTIDLVDDPRSYPADQVEIMGTVISWPRP